MKITKEMVLKGFSHKVKVDAPEYGQDAFFTVASPSASEVAEARAIRMQTSLKGDIKLGKIDPSQIDIAEALVAEEKARRFLIAKALSRGSLQAWTPEDAERIKPQVLNRIWNVIDGLIGFSAEAEEAIKNFPKARKGKK